MVDLQIIQQVYYRFVPSRFKSCVYIFFVDGANYNGGLSYRTGLSRTSRDSKILNAKFVEMTYKCLKNLSFTSPGDNEC